MANTTLTINHMYADSLNIYGDLGNILSLKYRAEQNGIKVEVVHTEIGTKMIEADIYFIGGGQDLDQMLVFRDLLTHKDFIQNEVDKGKIFLLICGGYQLFGEKFVDGNNNLIDGLHILDVETKAPDYSVSSRCIGNIIVEMNDDFVQKWNIDTAFSKYLVGFENHGGQTTFLSDVVTPIGNSIQGFGNNSIDRLEGCCYRNIIGCYMHGSLLPKNPHLTDAILGKALIEKKTPLSLKHEYLQSELEAHANILKNRHR